MPLVLPREISNNDHVGLGFLDQAHGFHRIRRLAADAPTGLPVNHLAQGFLEQGMVIHNKDLQILPIARGLCPCGLAYRDLPC